mgnify:CR=1 FL=1
MLIRPGIVERELIGTAVPAPRLGAVGRWDGREPGLCGSRGKHMATRGVARLHRGDERSG